MVLEDTPSFLDPLHDFASYTNYTSRYIATDGSLPYLLTGVKVGTNDYTSNDYLNEIYSKSDFIPKVAREEYDIKIYTTNKYVTRLKDGLISHYTSDYFCKLDFMKTVS